MNARSHWAPKARAVRKARTDAAIATLGALSLHKRPDTSGELAMTWTFYPPRGGRYDMDGLVGRAKALQDGIADALHMDDSRFVPTYRRGSAIKGGKVIVEVTNG